MPATWTAIGPAARPSAVSFRDADPGLELYLVHLLSRGPGGSGCFGTGAERRSPDCPPRRSPLPGLSSHPRAILAGRFAEAIEILDADRSPGRTRKPAPGLGRPRDEPHDRLGHHRQALAWLDRLRSAHPGPGPDRYLEELKLAVLRRETEALILLDPPFPTDPFGPGLNSGVIFGRKLGKTLGQGDKGFAAKKSEETLIGAFKKLQSLRHPVSRGTGLKVWGLGGRASKFACKQLRFAVSLPLVGLLPRPDSAGLPDHIVTISEARGFGLALNLSSPALSMKMALLRTGTIEYPPDNEVRSRLASDYRERGRARFLALADDVDSIFYKGEK